MVPLSENPVIEKYFTAHFGRYFHFQRPKENSITNSSKLLIFRSDLITQLLSWEQKVIQVLKSIEELLKSYPFWIASPIIGL